MTCLLLGILVLCLAGFYTWTGRAWDRSKWIGRSNSPVSYWVTVVIHYLGGICLLIQYLSD